MNIIDLKKEVYTKIQAGALSESVLDLIIPEHTPIPFECELWDYKEAYEENSHDYSKTVRSIASFYNTYGGYIIYGIKELEKDKSFELVGVEPGSLSIQKIKGQLDKYF